MKYNNCTIQIRDTVRNNEKTFTTYLKIVVICNGPSNGKLKNIYITFNKYLVKIKNSYLIRRFCFFERGLKHFACNNYFQIFSNRFFIIRYCVSYFYGAIIRFFFKYRKYFLETR